MINPKHLTEIQLKSAYLAGLFDGEGSFLVSIEDYPSPKFSIVLGSQDKEVIGWLHTTFKGNVHVIRTVASEFLFYEWYLGASQLDNLIIVVEAMLPHLRIKKDEAQQFLVFIKHYKTRPHKNCRGKRVDTQFKLWNTKSVALALMCQLSLKKRRDDRITTS